jgi:hypothetical protein
LDYIVVGYRTLGRQYFSIHPFKYVFPESSDFLGFRGEFGC